MFHCKTIISTIYLISVLLNTAYDVRAALGIRYNYSNPQQWSNEFPLCAGERQSPVATSVEDADSDLKSVSFSGLDTKPKKMKLYNNGNHVVVNYTYDMEPFVATGDLLRNNIYRGSVILFHFGPTNDIGSDHSVNGKTYSMEIQLYGFNTKYDNFDAAATMTDGLLAISIMVDIADETGQNEINRGMKSIVPMLKEITELSQETDIDPFPISLLFNVQYARRSVEQFLAYDGSMTFPPCLETVKWMIQMNPIYITESMMDEFRKITLFDGDNKNYRPIQERQSRHLTKVPVEK